MRQRGLVHYIDKEYEIAIELQKGAIEISDLLGSPRVGALARCSLAWPYISLGEYDQAQALLNQSLKIQEEHGIMEYWIDAKRCLAEVEIGRKNYSAAIKIAKIATKSAQEDEDPLEEGAALRVLGQAYHLNRNLKKAGESLEKSFTLLSENEYKYESYLTLQMLAKYYFDIGDTQKAQVSSAQVQTFAEEMGLHPEETSSTQK